ncbi:MAG TPA: hypothetical protein ENG60_04260, partial [Thermoplasmatales archaeon]|nr:hypothetical protein [Thermoplasmatales archaeon]HEX17603.1 hypothetical protein [Thermoplasmatales archaeon]
MVRRSARKDKAVSYPLQSVVAFSIILLMVAFYLTSMSESFRSYSIESIDKSSKSIDVCERLLSDPGQTEYLSMDWEKDPSNISSLGLGARTIAYIMNLSSGETSMGGYEGKSGGGVYYVGTSSFLGSSELTFNFSDERRFLLARLEGGGPLLPPDEWDESCMQYYIAEVVSPPPWAKSTIDVAYTRIVIGTGLSYSFFGDDLVEAVLTEDFPYAILDIRKIENLTKIDYERARKALGIHHDFNITIINETKATILSYGKSFDSR